TPFLHDTFSSRRLHVFGDALTRALLIQDAGKAVGPVAECPALVRTPAIAGADAERLGRDVLVGELVGLGDGARGWSTKNELTPIFRVDFLRKYVGTNDLCELSPGFP